MTRGTASGKKKAAVLGATGSIGTNTLDVLRNAKDDFEPALFAAQNDARSLLALAQEYPTSKIALSGEDTERILAGLPKKRVYYGQEGLIRAIYESGADIFVNGIAGAAGLAPSLAALDTGAALALANKESVVMAWELLEAKAQERGAKIIPVDSEHSAIFNLIHAHGGQGNIDEIILTASGGPFREWTREQLANATAEQALLHPTWSMGTKITIDSATLANKGLEVIEAARLFAMPPARITVTIHPQSIVHSMIRTVSGAIYAELSKPDMRLPIHNALFYDEPRPSPFARLEFDKPAETPLNLQFSRPDTARFPMLALAYSALEMGGCSAIAYNAANEEAVALFAASRINFYDIAAITETVLNHDWNKAAHSLDEVFDADRLARKIAGEKFRFGISKLTTT